MITKMCAIGLGICLAGAAQAGGYRVALQGQKALAMGHTGVAMTDSAETIFFNPGAITQLEAEMDIVGGITLLEGATIYQNDDTGSREETDNHGAMQFPCPPCQGRSARSGVECQATIRRTRNRR